MISIDVAPTRSRATLVLVLISVAMGTRRALDLFALGLTVATIRPELRVKEPAALSSMAV